ncbi:hypothetical protein AUEXF2481DRAFT_33967 [Aureobasidium subglaciale EXF-2481]|uniref:histidine kinase n=1 Tax=Aureobasidium subglaciale (strain EXF-2481) TaxID=1043005 RepID=A0A074XXY0_AURSE|nr:uncharacterized protein AUEXF2481DRAFT_33967 [Aureobasidium subglaciale EXF-2481]KAI5195386.1 hypothetical protein E4T38_09102 [Aureobasidium subglaciale]KAI5214421.1 hypothetical protein E4T40_09027 [Aureobasidium subglaciale]KAI5217009.1 hypothetical protein E4T41_09029 [Aureobasidium subglaciale]KAI5254753.1 hypothetical protein E4T46_09063 [Aureobasidium subglaciale]KEQ90428.1 hypothetical protein AUEXF2481DRAFT_33967 [Aureobasidium subglaciale EXF-2481]
MSTQSTTESVQEWLRLRALSRYLAPNNITADVVNAERGEPLAPSLAASPLLTAITQNGALRMNCDRAFVSLIDSSTQYILAEATRTISLRDSSNFANPQDALFLGVQTLDKEYGICPQSVAIFTDPTGRTEVDGHGVVANKTRYVIRDLRTLDQYKDCPYVVGFPHMVSYAEVPVKSASGHMLGTYCVMDNRIRDDFFSDTTIDILNDIAACITEHLELHAVKQDSGRGLQMMRGLSQFIESRRSAKEPSKSRQASVVSHNGSLDYFDHVTPADSTSVSSSPLSEGGSLDDSLMHNTTPLTSPDDHLALSGPEPLSSPSGLPNTSLPPTSPAVSSIKDVYSRAAHLIRAAIDVEGLVFLGGSTQTSMHDLTLSQTASNHKSHQPAPSCEVLGSSIIPGVSKLGSPGENLTLHDSSLRYLIRKFPRGCVFVADTNYCPNSSKEEVFIAQTYSQHTSSTAVKVPKELQALIRKARSLVFLPLWDSTQEKFIVGMLGWTSDPTRVLAEQDMTCLSAFGNTFMTEIARTEMTQLARAKSDFLSSISHELRSPLHGIHAAVDLLLDPQNESKTELVEMIQSCSSTLLDTLNHVLDFSRVNKLTDVDAESDALTCAEKTEASQNVFGDMSEEYLCGLVQDVVEGVHFGQASRKAAYNKMVSADLNNPTGNDSSLDTIIDGIRDTMPQTSDDAVAVYLYMESHAEWCMMLRAGAWKRLVMNLFANALKYTNEGFIEVTLKMVTYPDRPNKRTAHLMVSDTGIGMSPEFLRQAFEPFVQENPIADGTGLGLSIVKKIVDDLHGTIELQSTQGVGTRFDVFVPISDFDESKKLTHPPGGGVLDPKAALGGHTVCLLSNLLPINELSTSTASVDLQTRRITTMHVYVRSISEGWFGMKTTVSGSLEDVDADIIVAEESQIMSLMSTNPELSQTLNKRRIVLVGSHSHPTGSAYQIPNSVRLAYPLGPKALVRALTASLSQTFETQFPLVKHLKHTIPLGSPPPSQYVKAASNGLQTSTKIAKKVLKSEEGIGEVDVADGQAQQHFLLVDDNAINLRLLSTFMKKLGYTSETAINGLEAYEKFKANPRFTTILMDISMPIMNGFESSRAIRDHEALQPNMKAARIIALTGLGSEASKQEAKMSGIDEFYTKPVKFDALKALLQR